MKCAALTNARGLSAPMRGMALVLILAIVGVGALFGIMTWLNAQNNRLAREQETLAALAAAKEALLAYVAAQSLGAVAPGDLPCPDMDNDGVAETQCGNANGTTGQALRLGRLPWRTLGLADPAAGDPHDAAGLRLWFAASSNFKNNTRFSPRNSDTPGTITVRDAQGAVIDDAKAGAGVVAVIIAPGAAIRRLDGLQQDRSVANVNDPRHYLDNLSGEDNAAFIDGGGPGTTNDGFFLGPAKDALGNEIANDRAIVITRDDLDRAMRQRVAGEVALCLSDYRSAYGSYPWLAPLTDTTTYDDVPGTTWGRLPLVLDDSPGTNWTGKCSINAAGGWWNNWREQVFARIDPACGLEVDGKGGRCFVVLVAGRTLGSQDRSVKDQAANYLECGNETGDLAFLNGKTASCNDLAWENRP